MFLYMGCETVICKVLARAGLVPSTPRSVPFIALPQHVLNIQPIPLGLICTLGKVLGAKLILLLVAFGIYGVLLWGFLLVGVCSKLGNEPIDTFIAVCVDPGGLGIARVDFVSESRARPWSMLL
jgi:hypothetical protein